MQPSQQQLARMAAVSAHAAPVSSELHPCCQPHLAAPLWSSAGSADWTGALQGRLAFALHPYWVQLCTQTSWLDAARLKLHIGGPNAKQAMYTLSLVQS